MSAGATEASGSDHTGRHFQTFLEYLSGGVSPLNMLPPRSDLLCAISRAL